MYAAVAMRRCSIFSQPHLPDDDAWATCCREAKAASKRAAITQPRRPLLGVLEGLVHDDRDLIHVHLHMKWHSFVRHRTRAAQSVLGQDRRSPRLEEERLVQARPRQARPAGERQRQGRSWRVGVARWDLRSHPLRRTLPS